MLLYLVDIRRLLDVAVSPQSKKDDFSWFTIGITPYFQDVCRRDDVLRLPLECPRMNSTHKMKFSDLDCYTATQTTKMINFFSFAHGNKYVDMLPLYAFFALSNNPDSVVEMVVDNRDEFILNHAKELSWLLETFGASSVCVRTLQKETALRTNTTNTYRYLEQPVRRAKYTYIGDVDIFFHESVLAPKRLEQMRAWDIPYSNVIRPNSTRLTGVMLMKTEEFYTPNLISAQQDMNAKGNDEEFLYRIVNESGIGLPGANYDSDPLMKYRPVHGLHLSTNRGPGKRMCLPNFGRGPNAPWCGVLATPHLNEFLCWNGTRILLDSIAMVSLQMRSNMSNKVQEDGKQICS